MIRKEWPVIRNGISLSKGLSLGNGILLLILKCLIILDKFIFLLVLS